MSYPTCLGNGKPSRENMPYYTMKNPPPRLTVAHDMSQPPPAFSISTSQMATHGRRHSTTQLPPHPEQHGRALSSHSARPRAASAINPGALTSPLKRKFNEGNLSPDDINASVLSPKRVHSEPSGTGNTDNVSPRLSRSTNRRQNTRKPQSLDLLAQNACPPIPAGYNHTGPSTAPLPDTSSAGPSRGYTPSIIHVQHHPQIQMPVPEHHVSGYPSHAPVSAPPCATTIWDLPPPSSQVSHDPPTFAYQQAREYNALVPEHNVIVVTNDNDSSSCDDDDDDDDAEPLVPASSLRPEAENYSRSSEHKQQRILELNPTPSIPFIKVPFPSSVASEHTATLGRDSSCTSASRSVATGSTPLQPRSGQPTESNEELFSDTTLWDSASTPEQLSTRHSSSPPPEKNLDESLETLNEPVLEDPTRDVSSDDEKSDDDGDEDNEVEKDVDEVETLRKRKRTKTYPTFEDAMKDKDKPSELDAIDKLFRFQPPTIQLHKNKKQHTSSDKTKEPQMYDMHLHEDLILKRVIYCPKMEDDLLGLAKAAVIKCWNNDDIPVLSNGSFPSADKRHKYVTKPLNRTIKKEADVVRWYEKTTAKITMPVASALYFKQHTWASDPLAFQSHDPGKSQEAIADGFLHVLADVPTGAERPGMPSKRVLRRLDGHNILLWEFKSLTAGTLAAMSAIMELAGSDFSWIRCKHGLRTELCRNDHPPAPNSKHGGFRIDEPPVGVDASGPGVAEIWPTSLNSLDRDLKWDGKLPGVEISDKDRLYAIWIVQQIWTQCVKSDATLAVINAGNLEIYCRRNRADQTFAISRLIQIPERERYGQLQVGLYLAALLDIDLRLPKTPSTVGETKRRRRRTVSTRGAKAQQKGDGEENPDGEEGPHVPIQGNKIKMMDGSFSKAEKGSFDMFVSACHSRELIIDLQKNTSREVTVDVRGFMEKVTYHRYETLFDPCPDITGDIRVSVFGKLSRSVLLGTLRVGTTRFTGFPGTSNLVVIKLADSEDTLKKLTAEWDTYMRLGAAVSTKDHVPTVIGFFARRPPLRSPWLYALVLEYMGADLDPYVTSPPILNVLRDPFLKALRAIHAAGIRHGAITKRHHHLLVKNLDPPMVSFISFAHLTETVPSSNSLTDEKADLVELFDGTDPIVLATFIPRGQSPGIENEFKRQKVTTFTYDVRFASLAPFLETKTERKRREKDTQK